MYGLVFELVDADIVSNYLNAHPDQLENIAKQYAQTMKQLHTTHAAKGALGSTKELYAHAFADANRRAADAISDAYENAKTQVRNGKN